MCPPFDNAALTVIDVVAQLPSEVQTVIFAVPTVKPFKFKLVPASVAVTTAVLEFEKMEREEFAGAPTTEMDEF